MRQHQLAAVLTVAGALLASAGVQAASPADQQHAFAEQLGDVHKLRSKDVWRDVLRDILK